MIPFENGQLRLWVASDREALAALADDERVSANMRDRFPWPYTLGDAERWIAHAPSLSPGELAIEHEGVLVGGLGAHRFTDVHRFTAEVGYWLGAPHWGRGIATRAVRAFSDWLLATTDLERLQADVFSWNPASMRVVEKCGYTLEGVHRRAVHKRGRLCDVHVYARLR